MDPKLFPVTMGEYGTFHSIDRALYSVLANDLWRDPYESVQVLAFWLWIERQGFKNFILLISSMHPSLVSKYADEALTCVKCINDRWFVFPAEASAIPLTSSLLKDKISLQYFQENRTTVVKEIRKIVTDVCAMALQDLIEEAVRKRNAFESLTKNLANLGFVGEMPRSSHRAGEPPEDRTMFVTFSRGYPLTEAEVRAFFNMRYGNCIEGFHMQIVNPHDQPLYAKVVFRTPAIINMILDGNSKAKFTINGKHLWMRRFESRRRNSPPRPLQQ